MLSVRQSITHPKIEIRRFQPNGNTENVAILTGQDTAHFLIY
jgi:hypothetical protein